MFVLGINIPNHLPVSTGLTHLKGIGRHRALLICAKLSIHPQARIGSLRDWLISQIVHCTKPYLLDSDLQKAVKEHVDHHISIKSFKGFRHIFGLPVRGQRTHTNAQTAKKLALFATRRRSKSLVRKPIIKR